MSRFFQFLWLAALTMFGVMGGSACAAEAGAEHGLEQAAPHLFSIPLPGGIELPVSNSMLMLFLAVLLIGVVVWSATRSMRILPSRLQNAVEYFFETLYNFVKSLLGPRLTRKYFWYFGTIFTIILVSNYMGLLPGVGTVTYHGVPLFRGANADMNVTMFLGIFYALMWLYWSIREQGLKGFFMHLFGPKGRLPGFMGFVLVFIFIFVGLVDVLSITIRPIALAARLYGNIYAGETIIDTMAHMFGPVLSALCVLPFLAIELLVGFIQALVFLLLTAIFLKLQVGDDDAHGHTSKNEEKELSVPDHGRPVGERSTKNINHTNNMIDPIAMTSLAELSGNVGFGLVTIGAGLGIGLIGAKAAEATGRNPGASSPIMVIAITLAALIEGVALISIFVK